MNDQNELPQLNNKEDSFILNSLSPDSQKPPIQISLEPPPKSPFVPIVGIAVGAFILFIIVAGSFAPPGKNQSYYSQQPKITPTPTATPTITPTPTPTPIPVGMPTKVEIPKIKVIANVVSIGIAPNHTMDVPKKASDIGWFEEGIKPGQVGAAILVGHYDTPSGRPAIFYQLRKLAEGDEIIVLTSFSEKFTFRVEKVFAESYKTFPKDLIYGRLMTRELRLITCGGVWDPKEKSYSKRLVVFAKLWAEEKLESSEKP